MEAVSAWPPYYRRLVPTELRALIPYEFRRLLKWGLGAIDPIIQVHELSHRLNDLGFVERAQDDLDRFTEGSDASVRQRASWFLAVWHANQRSSEGAAAALALLDRHHDALADLDVHRKEAVLRSECYATLGDIEAAHAGIAAALETEQHPDLYLAAANLHAEPPERLARINEALRLCNLCELSLRPDEGSRLYDRLAAAKVLPYADGPKITVIVPAFNAAEYIATAMEALIAQTWKNLEVLVIDDLSSDATADIVSSFSVRDTRIRLIRAEANRGSYVARNIALREASGEFVTTHDSDDWSHPQKLEVQARHLLSDPHAAANMSQQARATSALVFRRRGSPGFYMFDNLSSLMFRRDLVQSRLGYWDAVRFGADSEFIERIRATFGANSVASVPGGLLSFQRQSQGSLTGSDLFGYHGYLMGARRAYHEVSRRHHRRSRSLSYSSDFSERPFPVPEPMLPVRTTQKDKRRYFDVILAADFRVPGLVAESAYRYLESGLREGRRIGLIQLAGYDVEALAPILPAFGTLAEEGALHLLVVGERARCRRLVVLDADVLRDYQRFVPDIEAETLEVLAPNLPSKSASVARATREWLTACAGNARRYFSSSGTWYIPNHERLKVIKRYEPEIDVASFASARKMISKFGLGPYSRRLRAVFIAGILVSIGVNASQFGNLESKTSPNYRALLHYQDRGLFPVAFENNRSVALRVAPFYFFGLINPNSTIIMPSTGLKTWFELDLGMMSFGRARELRVRTYDPQSLNVPDLQAYKVDLGGVIPDRKTLRRLNSRLSIFRRSSEADTFVVFAPKGAPGRTNPMLFVDIDLLDGSTQKALR